MNITVLGGVSRDAGGVFYALSSLCRLLKQREGMEVSVYGSKTEHYEDSLPAWGTVSVQAYNAYGPLQFSPVLRRWMRTTDADIVHCHGIWTDPQWAALQWQKRTAKPVIISPHGMLDPWAVKNSAWKKKLAGALFANESLHRADCIHALCQSEAESIRRYGLKNPIAVIPNGIELPETGALHGKPQSSHGKKQLLFLGRIHPKKGLAELLQAWGMKHATWRQEWQLLIAGWDDGGHQEGLKVLCEELGISDSVSFLGKRFGAEKDELLRSVDAFILPSFSEGLPMSVLEAWAYGLPVIMTGFCNIPEGFEAAAALMVEPTPESIAAGLHQLVDMSDVDLQIMGRNGRSLVEEKFAWPKIAASMKQTYEWCLAGGNPPECIEL